MRTIPGPIAALLESGRFSIRYMVLFDLVSGLTGVWNDTYSLSYGGNTYAPLAGNMSISTLRASSDLDTDRVTVTITNLQNAASTIIANEVWHQRACTVFVAFLNDAGEVQHVEARFSGFLDHVEISDAANDLCTVTLSIESNSRELGRSNGDTRNDASQRRRSATDGFFKHTAYVAADASINWGRKGPQYPRGAVIKR